MTENQRNSCVAIIHSTSVAVASSGVALAQIPGSYMPSLLPAQARMIVALGEIFGITVPDQNARELALSLIGLNVGRSVSQVLLGWIPGLGSVINAATASAITEAIGWAVVSKFDQGWGLDSEVLKNAQATFGNDVAPLWLTAECQALGNSRPIDLLRTPEGRRQVLDVLNCIDHGFAY